MDADENVNRFPLVSVIIPVYNVKMFLHECVDSVINQTYQNLEIIIIDDGSTDGSGFICDYYKNIDGRINVIHQENLGLSGARNTGLDNMHGEIVAFLDSDDAFLPNMIETMVNHMLRTKADIVECGHYTCNTNSHMRAINQYSVFQFKTELLTNQRALHYLVQDKIVVNVWDKIYSRNLFNELRFKEGSIYEDLLLMPYLIECAKRVLLIEEPLVLYRKRSGSITDTHSEKNMLEWIYARNQFEIFVSQRIPSIFNAKQLAILIERNLKYLIYDHTNLLLHLKSISRSIEKVFKSEIEKRASFIGKFRLKTRILLRIYLINPRLCLYIMKCYSFLVVIYLKFLSMLKGNKYGQNTRDWQNL